MERRLLRLLLATVTILLPFNSVPWYPEWFGELKEEAWIGPAACILLLWAGLAVARRRLPWPRRHGADWLAVCIVWATMSTIFNAGLLEAAGLLYFKGRGLDKLALQVGVFVSLATFAVSSYGIFQSEEALMSLRWLRRLILWSLVAPTGVALLETLSLVTHAPQKVAELLRLISELVHRKIEYEERVRSVSGEASWFGIWLGFVLPWLVSDAMRLRPLGVGGFLAAAVAAGFTFSRFTWVVTGLICAGFVASGWGRGRRKLAGAALALGVGAVGAVVWMTEAERAGIILRSFTLTQETPHWVSNVSRIGMQVAAVKMAFASPLLGVGLGGFGFRVREFVPDWAAVSPEVQEWLAETEGTAWPPVHGLWARLAAETGFAGLALFAAAWAAFLRSAWHRARNWRKVGEVELADLWLAVFCSGVSCLLVGFNFDSFRFGGYWLLLGVGWAAMAAEDRAGAGRRESAGEGCRSASPATR